MLSLKYVMAKSKELTSKLELGSVVSSVRSGNADVASNTGSVVGNDVGTTHSVGEDDLRTATEGNTFLMEQNKDWQAVLVRHRKLLQSGDVLSEELTRARKRLQAQTESQAYVSAHFHEIKRVREQLGTLRGLVEKIAEDVEDVEQYLMQQTEEYMAAQNASFVARQERELDLFEERILEEKEGRKQQLLAARRQVLAEAFQNDLKTYQTLVAYQGPVVTQRAVSAAEEESLESVDLVVNADAAQLEAFYDTEDDDDVAVHFPEEEEKSNDEHDDDELKARDVEVVEATPSKETLVVEEKEMVLEETHESAIEKISEGDEQEEEK